VNKSVLVCISILFSLHVNAQDLWKKYRAPDNSFSISCPGGVMSYSEKDVETGVGRLNNKVHFLNMDKEHPNFLYMVTSVDYPEGTFNSDSLDLMVEYFKEASLSLEQTTGCKLQYKLIEVYDEIPNMILRLSDETSGTGIKAKMFIKGDVLYTVQAFTTNANQLNDFIDDFINSFHINY
jgi:hypothetical protein